MDTSKNINNAFHSEMQTFQNKLSLKEGRFERHGKPFIKKIGNEYFLACFNIFFDKQSERILRVSKLRYWNTKKQTVVSHIILNNMIQLFDFPIKLPSYPVSDEIYEPSIEEYDNFIESQITFSNISDVILNEINSRTLSTKTAKKYLEAWKAVIGSAEEQIYFKLFAEEYSLIASCAKKCSGKIILPL